MAIGIGGAIIGGSLISGIGAGLGGLAGSSAAKKAAALQAAQFAQTREDLAPFREAGVTSLNQLQILLGLSGTPEEQQAARDALTSSPNFQFQLGQGVTALDQSAAARGGLLSGNQLKGVTEFGQGLASNTFSSRFNQLSAIAGLGQNAAAQTGNLGAQSAANQGNALIAGGQARASGFAGVANAATAGVGNFLFNNFLTQQATNKAGVQPFNNPSAGFG